MRVDRKALERIQKRLDNNNVPSDTAKTVVRDMDSNRAAKLFEKAVKKYNSKHERKIFA